MPKYWKPQPLHTAIIEALRKKQGVLIDNELYKALHEVYDDLCPSYLNKALMKLEVDGLLHVYSLTRTKRRIELVKEDS